MIFCLTLLIPPFLNKLANSRTGHHPLLWLLSQLCCRVLLIRSVPWRETRFHSLPPQIRIKWSVRDLANLLRNGGILTHPSTCEYKRQAKNQEVYSSLSRSETICFPYVRAYRNIHVRPTRSQLCHLRTLL